jgi:midasin
MRRTKPSKRDYQVMMMIDDSSSMGQAGPLAMSALTVISGALSRLEVGSIGVCAFSEKLTPMHSFSSPFTDEAGASLYSQFKFQASQTRLASALQSVVPMFEEARRLASSSSNVVLQICFVISDARIDSDNREKLNKIVRELAEKNILAVLIIIDKNDDHNDSIFATKTVEFTSSGLVTKGYLDEFPFPYYVAIQQVEALPDVLSDVLKQWFELVQTQLND